MRPCPSKPSGQTTLVHTLELSLNWTVRKLLVAPAGIRLPSSISHLPIFTKNFFQAQPSYPRICLGKQILHFPEVKTKNAHLVESCILLRQGGVLVSGLQGVGPGLQAQTTMAAPRAGAGRREVRPELVPAIWTSAASPELTERLQP